MFSKLSHRNRSTHAIRALTSFVVYEAAYSLAAGITAAIAFIPLFSLEEPWWFFLILAVGIAIGGLFHSFSVAFGELAKSEIVTYPAAVGIRSSISGTKRASVSSGQLGQEDVVVLPGRCDCGPSTRRGSGADTIRNQDVCRNCSRPIVDGAKR